MEDQYLNTDVVAKLKALIELHGTWGKAKPFAKAILITLDRQPSVQEIYDAVYEITPFDKMAPCGTEKKFFGFWGGYKFCGNLDKCSCAALNTKEKSEKTFLKKYGTKRPLQNKDIYEKMQQTNLERYGSTSVLSTDVIKDKIRATNLERYGCPNASSSDVVKDRIKATNLERYGVEYGLQADSVKEKTRNTIFEKYGVDHIGKAEAIKDKIKQTNLDRYGTAHTFETQDFKNKSKASMMERYGVDHVSKSPVIQERIKATNMVRYGAEKPFASQEIQQKAITTNGNKSLDDRRLYLEKIKNKFGRLGSSLLISQEAYDVLSNADELEKFGKGKSIHEIANGLKVHPSTVLKRWHEHNFPISQSRYEELIGEWLDTHDIKHVKTRKIIKGFEIDFYLPDHNLAIEFNGIYWHSTKFKSESYHREKYQACHKAGIRLLMINEDEWIERSDAIKSRILHLINRSPKGKSARQLSIRVIDSQIANSFFDINHIQGKTGTIKHAMGAFDQDILVAAMAFNKQRTTGVTELIRFCSDKDSHAGLFSRLFKHAVHEFDLKEVISFADLRYSIGDVYYSNGFEFVGDIKPDYRYAKGVRTFHKSSFTKKKIENKFNLDMSTLTEKSAMESLGFLRIYDCGKAKFIWKRLT